MNPPRFHNTLAGKIEEFHPLCPGEVGIYTCGPTVYDFAHIGNFRAFVFEDLLRRFLEFRGFKVRHVMNLTDVDDKTIAGARREGKPLAEFTEKYVRAFQEDLAALNILRPNHPAEPPRATREIPAMIQLIERLLEKDRAYVSEGSVYYRVSSFPGYGKLSKKNLAQNIQGARVDVDEYDKEEGSDFALWKKSKEGEPAWDSPWGKGRPGWHLECSAMSMKYLGETFDLHAGGEDLVFPHHENEIAQSEGATGLPFVRTWLHCRFLLVNGEKMSKSKGNYYTLRDLLAQGYDPMALRYALISTHYRQPLNFTLDGLKEGVEVIKKLDDCYCQCWSRKISRAIFISQEVFEKGSSGLKFVLEDMLEKIGNELGADLNISAALATMFEAVKEINIRLSKDDMGDEDFQSAIDFFERLDQLFGFDISAVKSIPDEIVDIFRKRTKLRMQREFKEDPRLRQETDNLREELKKRGWLVLDSRPIEISTLKKRRRVWDK